MVTGDGFGAGSSGRVLFASTPVQIKTFRADATGRVSELVRIPAGATAGPHHIIIEGVDAEGAARNVRIPVTVQGATGSIPRTGTDSLPTASVGLALVMLGIAYGLLGTRMQIVGSSGPMAPTAGGTSVAQRLLRMRTGQARTH